MRTIAIVAEIGDIVRMELDRDVEAIVTAITVREEGIAYELTWMAGGEIKAAWLPAVGIHLDREPKTIGFEKRSEA